jgi:hypothetical protein
MQEEKAATELLLALPDYHNITEVVVVVEVTKVVIKVLLQQHKVAKVAAAEVARLIFTMML